MEGLSKSMCCAKLYKTLPIFNSKKIENRYVAVNVDIVAVRLGNVVNPSSL